MPTERHTSLLFILGQISIDNNKIEEKQEEIYKASIIIKRNWISELYRARENECFAYLLLFTVKWT